MKGIDDTGYKYLGILKCDRMKEKEMNDVFITEYQWGLKLVFKLKVKRKNKILVINMWVVAILGELIYGMSIILIELLKMNQ